VRATETRALRFLSFVKKISLVHNCTGQKSGDRSQNKRLKPLLFSFGLLTSDFCLLLSSPSLLFPVVQDDAEADEAVYQHQ
jgi:hypothetical protein